jgi:hypothetical protein
MNWMPKLPSVEYGLMMLSIRRFFYNTVRAPKKELE